MDAQARLQRQAQRPGDTAKGAKTAGPRHEQMSAIATGLNVAVQQRFAATTAAPVQRRESGGSLPDRLKAGVEALSGLSMDHVRVHRNSDKPRQLNAHAYAQGADIHLAPGHERHLPHEAWHVVQQAQGRVRPTTQLKPGIPINDAHALEHEADILGAKAAAGGSPAVTQRIAAPSPSAAVAQRTPAQWRANPQIPIILGLAHGWFSTWKQIKQEIVLYQGLNAANIVARRASLTRMTTLIAEWLANPKHPAHGGTQRVQRIHANLPTLQHLIAEERAEMIAEETEAAVGGHSLVRHGADATDLELMKRITTGYDRGGKLAATGQSSRFKSHQEWLRTRTLAVNALDAATAATRAIIDPLLQDFENAWWAVHEMPGGPDRGTAMRALVVAGGPRDQISNAITRIGRSNPNHLPVTYHVNVAVRDNSPRPALKASVAQMVWSREKYAITIDHGAPVGPSFIGHGGANADGVYPAAVPGPSQQHTTTVLRPPIGNLAALGPAATWPMVTHFPSSDLVGINSA